LKAILRHFGESLEAGSSSAGVFLVKRHAPVADGIEALPLVWAASDQNEWRDRILVPEP
jgi:hypothetical protein